MHATKPAPTDTACCSEDEVIRLVHGFYAQVRLDPLLGPVFERHVGDWDHHLQHLVDFWSAMLRGTRRFGGAPMARHLAVPGLDAAMFARWLELFATATTLIDNPAMKTVADARAAQIGARFLAQYQAVHAPALPA
jgi:hemoglobin